ncbi:hypothetical protein ACWDA7_42540 [Streptomyces sp. NPDC001156]
MVAPFPGYRCQYVTDWVADRTRCGLAFEPAEILTRCPDVPVTVTLAH